MTATFTPRRGDLVTCDAMSNPHEVHLECGHPVLIERPAERLSPFAQRVQAAKARSERYAAVRS